MTAPLVAESASIGLPRKVDATNENITEQSAGRPHQLLKSTSTDSNDSNSSTGAAVGESKLPPINDDGAAEPKVGSVVAKAKRAASWLWLLLHAQNCRLGGGRCPYKGCRDAKLILLHLKTCPARSGSDCPQSHEGCAQSRKLLAHYKQCREVRAKQAMNMKRTSKAQPPACLVCSLLARQVRTVIDSSGKSNPSALSRKPSSTGNKKVLAPFTMKQNPNTSSVVVPGLIHGAGKEDMPPPPPRFPQASMPIPIRKAEASNPLEPQMCESPPPSSVLMRRELSAVAAVAAPDTETSDISLLGKSVDSSRRSYMKQATNKIRRAPAYRRRRSGSLDAAAVAKAAQSRLEAATEETLESEQLLVAKGSVGSVALGTRGRSVSMGALASFTDCDTIVEEEPLSPEEHNFFEDDT